MYKSKVKLTILVTLFIALSVLAAIGLIFALKQQTLTTSINVSFYAEDIDGSVTATYQLLSEDGTKDGEIVNLGTISFDAQDKIYEPYDLSPSDDLTLSTDTPYIEFTYYFSNTGSLDYIATLSLVDVTEDANIGFDYKYKDNDYGEDNFAILVQGIENRTDKSQSTYRVRMKVEDIALNASWIGSFYWDMKSFEAETTEEKLSVRSMDYTDNGDGTYSASFSGGKLENNTLVISGNIGGVQITSVGLIRNLPTNAKVVLGEGITTIEADAFSNTNLADIELPDSLESIGGSAFYVAQLTSITIPASVTSIGYRSLAYCYRLEEIIVEEGNPVYTSDQNCLIENGTGLIAGCKNSVIPNYITEIADSAFMGHYNLTSITIPKSVENVGPNAFGYNSNLASIIVEEGGVLTGENNCVIKGTVLLAGCKNSVIPDYITEIGKSAFCGNRGLTSIVIPDSVEIINTYAFFSTGLTSLDLGQGVEYIGTCAFSCIYLTSLTIPASVTTIGYGVFDRINTLTKIYLLSTNESLIVAQNAFANLTAKFYCCLSGVGVNWNANWQNLLTVEFGKK